MIKKQKKNFFGKVSEFFLPLNERKVFTGKRPI